MSARCTAQQKICAHALEPAHCVSNATIPSDRRQRPVGEILDKDAALARRVNADLERQESAEDIVVDARDLAAQTVQRPGFAAVLRVVVGDELRSLVSRRRTLREVRGDDIQVCSSFQANALVRSGVMPRPTKAL